MSATRQATGTPIAELFDNADRIAELERKVDQLYRLLGVAAQAQILNSDRLKRLEGQRQVPEPWGELLP